MQGQQVGISLIIIILLITAFYQGYRLGLIRYLIPLLTLVCSLISLHIISPCIEGIIKDNKIVNQTIESSILDGYESIKEGDKNSDLSSNSLVNLLPDSKLKNYLQTTTSIEDKLFSYSSTFIVQFAMKIIIFICSMIVMGLIFRLLFSSLNTVARTPVISTFNKLGGGIASILEKLIVTWIVMTAIAFFADTNAGSILLVFINNNGMLKCLYILNPLIKFI